MKKIGKIFLIILGIVLIFYLALLFFSREKKSDMIVGVSFQTDYARYIGADYQDVFTTILDQWKFRHIRIAAQWNSIEKEEGRFDFTETDWLMNEANKRGAKIILAVGQKTPRWPECHSPDWAKGLTDEKYFMALDNYVATVVKHFQNHPALDIWQVENEPFLVFGENCRPLSGGQFKKELANVRLGDSTHKILVTDSGELSTWWRTAKAGDLFGTTLYRMVWDEQLGYWSYDWMPAAFYRFKLWLAGQSAANAFIVELQAEPWLPNKQLSEVTMDEQKKIMDLDRLKNNIDYASRLQFSRAYLWGAEWWYWLAKQGNNEIPDFIRDLPKEP